MGTILYLVEECAMFFYGPSLDCQIISVKMKGNRCYPLSLMLEKQLVLKTSFGHYTWTWHRRLGYFNFGGINLLNDKDMVHGLLYLERVRWSL